MSRVEKLTDVPDSAVDQVVKDYKTAGAVDVKKQRQPNGLWTVIATFP